mgnify:CR=1 FL=1
MTPSSEEPTISGPAPAEPVSRRPSTDHGRFLPGSIVTERFRIIGLLGRGGMGEVYRAEDLKLGQEVALKFLPPGFERDPVRLEHFLGEARTARHVTHSNVCRVHDIGEYAGHHYLSMEYVDGEDLGSLLRRIGRVPPERALLIARQACDGLAAAHAQGVLHRDLKPANVMIDGRGRVRITDFGLATWVQDERNDEIAGTPAYMAPEQISGEGVSVQSDLYSLGLVLYELFTGRRAFEARSLQEYRRAHREQPPTPPREHVPELDPAIEDAILRCLAKDPARRPASAAEIVASLPGLDPIAMAQEAGETPSPQLVAEARGELTSPRALVAWLALLLAACAVVWLLPGGVTLTERVELPLEPEVLAFRAREVLAAEDAQRAPPADTAYGFEEREHEGAPTLVFWYRESRHLLIPALDDLAVARLGADNPPLAVGDRVLWLDAAGTPLRREERTPDGSLVVKDLDARGAALAPEPRPDDGGASGVVLTVLRLAFFATVFLMVARNVRAGRVDRTGAFRLGLVTVLAVSASWLLAAHRLALPGLRVMDWMRIGVALALLVGGQLWLFYVAIEPFLRKQWPRRLTTWTRLAHGDWRDPLVARDVLVGTAAMVAFVAVLQVLFRAVPSSHSTFHFQLSSLLGTRQVLGNLLYHTVYAAMYAWGVAAFLLVFFSVTRRLWLAIALDAAVLGILHGLQFSYPDGMSWLNVAMWPAGLALCLVVFARFGMLALVATQCVLFWFASSPGSASPTAWAGFPVRTALVLLAALGVATFLGALAGRPVLAAPAPRRV